MHSDTTTELLENQYRIIEKQSKLLEQQGQVIAEQSQMIANLEETVNYLKNKLFGTSSEKRKKAEIEGQLFFFNEIEALVDPALDEPEAEDILVPKEKRKKKPRTRREELLAKLPVEKIFCDLTDDEKQCEWCNTQLVLLGEEFVREELQIIPAKLKRIHYMRKIYHCLPCKDEGTPVIVKAKTPTPLLKHSLASPSTVAHIMYQKFVNHMPLNRQEKDLEQEGVYLNRGTMANWLNTTAINYFKPVYGRMHEHLVKREAVMSDETTCQVLKEDGRAATAKSYMWVHRTGEFDKQPIILYDYCPGRAGEHAVSFLKGFSGYHMCDGYSGYNKIEGVIRCGCWSHMRRYLLETLPQKKVGKNKYPAVGAVDYIDKIFDYEREFAEFTPEKRKKKRLELEKPILDVFWRWVDSQNPPNGSMLDRAVTYAKNQRVYLMNYLLDGRCSFSNNASERSVRPYTQGRKNYLFHDTTKGAEASAIIYSMVETAKAYNLNIYSYLQTLLLYMPDYTNEPDGIESMMPWSEVIQNKCKLKS